MRRASDQASFYHLGVGHERQGGGRYFCVEGRARWRRSHRARFIQWCPGGGHSSSTRVRWCTVSWMRGRALTFARTRDAPCRGLRPAPE